MDRLTCKCDGDNVLKELCIFDRESNINDCLGCKEYCDTVDDLGGDCDNCAIQKAFDKLAEYEDLEEQGLLLRLPCKIGTEVYSAEKLYDTIGEKTYKTFFVLSEKFNVNMIEDFGKTVFLTKEEAEQALKRLECAEWQI